MASAHTLPLAEDRALRAGFFHVKDPGASGTFDLINKGHAIVEVVTAAAESRAMPSVTGYAPGTTLTVVLKTDGGDCTISGVNGNESAILDTAGHVAVFELVNVNGTNTWKQISAVPFQRNRYSTADTSGSFDLIYSRLAFEADGTAGGEALRAFTNVNANIGTARGAHISLSFEAAAGGSECSGLGTALTCTTHIPDVASWAPTGTLYGLQVELFSDGAASDPAGLTELALLCLSNSGNATGAADVDTDAFILSLQGFTAGAGKAVDSTSLAELPAGSIALKIKVGSATYYIPAVAAAELN